MRLFFIKKQNLYQFTATFLLFIGLCAFVKLYRDPSVPVVAQVGVPVPIIMYHSIYEDPNKGNIYVLSPAALEADLKYFQENGYQTVLIKDLIAYTENNGSLPEKPVVLTFDDGYLNNKTNVLPLLEKYNMCAVISVVGEFTDIFSETKDVNTRYSHMTWDDIAEIAETQRIEIGNHTYNLHHDGARKGSKIKPGESVQAYKSMLEQDLLTLQQSLVERSGVLPVTFTYPYGHISEESFDVIKEIGFKASLSCYEKINYITRDPSSLYSLGRYNRPSGVSTQKFMTKVLPLSQSQNELK